MPTRGLGNNSGPWRYLAGGSLAVAITTVFMMRRHPASLLVSTGDAAALGKLWNSATEFMLSVPPESEHVVLVPREQAKGKTVKKIPQYFASHVVFVLTAFDPPGQSRSLEVNTRENGRLFQKLSELRSEGRVTAIWPAFGVHVVEKWREDGFCVAFSRSDAAAGRSAIMAIATAFGQGAVYEYTAATSSLDREWELLRHTVPAVSGPEVAGTEKMVRVETGPPIEGTALDRPWAGPEGWH